MAWSAGRLALMGALLWSVSTPCPTARGDEREERFDTYLKARVEVSRFSGSVLVAQGDRVLFERGFGLANREHAIPNTPATKFRLGSITKQFTAMAVLILQDEGKLRVGDTVKTYLDDAPASWDAITIHHLLTHTSGLPNFTSFPDYEATMREPSPPPKTMARFRDKPLEFAPGEVQDMARWDRALAQKKLISADAYAAYFQPFKGGYAYGWAVDERFGKKRVGHGGGINGFCTQFDRYPDDDLCVVVLCNLDGLDPGGIAHDLAAIVFGEPYEIPEAPHEVAIDPKLLDAYVGAYEIENGPTITIVKDGDGLALKGPNGSPARLYASSETRFFLKIQEGSIEFVKDEQGHVTGANVAIRRQKLKAKRVDAGKDG